MSKILNFNLAGDPGDDTPVIIADNPPGGTQLASHFEGTPPNRWIVTVPLEITGGAWVTYQHGHKRFRVIVPPGEGSWEAGMPPCLPPEASGPNDAALIYTPLAVFLPALERRG